MELEHYVRDLLSKVDANGAEFVGVEQFGELPRKTAILRRAPSGLLLHFFRQAKLTLGLADNCREVIKQQLEAMNLEDGLELLDAIPPPFALTLGDFCITPRPLTVDQLGALRGEESVGEDSYQALTQQEADGLELGALKLPSAAELEVAALGGRAAAFFWGNELPDVDRWNEDSISSEPTAVNCAGLTDVLAFREWCREGDALRVKGGAAGLFPWQGSEGLLMLPSLTERASVGEAALVRLVLRWR